MLTPKMKHKLTSIISICLVLSSLLIQAQAKQTDTVTTKTNRYGLFVGVDLYKLGLTIFDPDYNGFEVTSQYRLSKKYFLAAEIGNDNLTVNDDQLSFTTNGSYITAGVNYNLYENWLDMENQIYVGMRYGFSSFSQTLNNYSIYNPYPYFGQAPLVQSGEKFSGLSAQWIEIIMGVNVKVYNNIFVGFGVNLNILVANDTPPNFDNLFIPGFNRTYDGDFGVGFNYTVSYFIPIYKKQVIPAEVKKK